jgi:hypothetical protein
MHLTWQKSRAWGEERLEKHGFKEFEGHGEHQAYRWAGIGVVFILLIGLRHLLLAGGLLMHGKGGYLSSELRYMEACIRRFITFSEFETCY